MMKDKVAETYSKLVGLIAGLISVPLDFSLLIAVGDDGNVVVHEVKNVMYDARNKEVLWFTQGMEKYTKIRNALETWGIKTPMEDWLGERLEKKDEELELYYKANKVLYARVSQLERESSRWREESARLQKLMDELAEKHYAEDSHGDL